MTNLSLTDDGEFLSLDLRSADASKTIKTKDMLPGWALPILTTPERWENYSNPLIYETDKRIREWIGAMKSVWTNRKGNDRRYCRKDLVEILGLEDAIKTAHDNKIVSRIFAYYSTRIVERSTINNKRVKKVYTLSPRRLKRKPYSLKLRLEELEGEGCWANFTLPKDDLEVGHARNPRTEANIEKRKQAGRERANAALREWRERTGRHGESGAGSR